MENEGKFLLLKIGLFFGRVMIFGNLLMLYSMNISFVSKFLDVRKWF